MALVVDERCRGSVSARGVEVMKDVKDMDATFLIALTHCDCMNACSISCIVYDEREAQRSARVAERNRAINIDRQRKSWRVCRRVAGLSGNVGKCREKAGVVWKCPDTIPWHITMRAISRLDALCRAWLLH